MSRLSLLLLLSFTTAPAIAADPADPLRDPALLLEPYEHDVYGPGVHSDAAGRPFEFETAEGQRVDGDVRQGAYGPGVHMDEYGRPVTAAPW